MSEGFDPRIVRPQVLEFLQACQRAVPFHLGGGAALSGVHLRHRLSADADLFVHAREAHRDLVRALPGIGAATNSPVSILRDAGSLVRARLEFASDPVELDVVFEPGADIEPAPPAIDGVVVESLVDLRANKLTCLLSRSEPRDPATSSISSSWTGLDIRPKPISHLRFRRTRASIQASSPGCSVSFRSAHSQ